MTQQYDATYSYKSSSNHDSHGSMICGRLLRLFAVVCFLIIVAYGSFAILSPVVSASEPIENTYPCHMSDRDTLLNATADELYTRFDEWRAIYGTGTVQKAQILEESAIYAAVYAMQTNGAELSETAVADSVTGVLDTMSYVKGRAFVYIDRYYSVSADITADTIMRIIQTDSNYEQLLLRTDVRSIGIGICRIDKDGESTLCAVIVAAETDDVSQSESVVPNGYFTVDTVAPVVSFEPIFILKGQELTENMVLSAITVQDERGEQIRPQFDLTTVNTSDSGSFLLSVSATDASGNAATVQLPVTVAANTRPTVELTAVIPYIEGCHFIDISKYIQAADAYGVASIVTEPAFVRVDETSDGQTLDVTATVVNVVGNSTVTTVNLTFALTEREAINASVDGIVTVYAAKGDTVREGKASVIDGRMSDVVEGASYRYSITEADGNVYYYVSDSGSDSGILVWYPKVDGDALIVLDICEPETGKIISSSNVVITVAKKDEIVYNTPVVDFPAASGIVLDRDRRFLYGVTIGMTLSDLEDAATISGGENPTLVFTDTAGQALDKSSTAATAITASLTDRGNIIESFMIIVYGDMNCNGQVDIGDFAMIRQEMLRGNIISGIAATTADVNRNGEIDIGDFAMMRQCMLGRLQIPQG